MDKMKLACSRSSESHKSAQVLHLVSLVCLLILLKVSKVIQYWAVLSWKPKFIVLV